jgi:hypothetical protein
MVTEVKRLQFIDGVNVNTPEQTSLAVIPSVTVTTTPYTALETDSVIYVDTTAGAITINLPAVATASSNGKFYYIKKISTDSNTVTIDPNGAELIEEAASIQLFKQNDCVQAHCDSLKWRLISDQKNFLVDMYSTQVIAGNKSFSSVTTVTNTTESTTKDNGALVVEGGVGIEKNLNVGGSAVITGNTTIDGDLTVNGTTTTLNTATLTVEDQNINVNKGGNQSSADDQAGITVEMSDATHAKILYDKDLASKWKLGNSGSEKEVITAGDTQTMTTKTFSDSVTFAEIATPATPAAGFVKIYPKTDKKFYLKDSTGLEEQIGSGGGGGATGENFITGDDYDFEAGIGNWTRYKNTTPGALPEVAPGGSPTANLTFTQNATAPLTGTFDGKLAKTGGVSVQGEGIYLDITPDIGYAAAGILTKFLCLVDSLYADNDITLHILDKTTNTFIPVNPYQLKKSSLVERIFFEFQNPATLTSGIRFYIHVASTSTANWTANFDLFDMQPKTTSFAASDTDLLTYTPTFLGFGTVTGARGDYRRKGQMLDVWGEVTTGTPTAVSAALSLPTSLSAKAISTTSTQVVGEWTRSSTAEFNKGPLLLNTANGVTNIFFGGATSISAAGPDPLSIALGNTIAGTGQRISFKFSVPILGWSTGSEISDIYIGRDVSFSTNTSTTSLTNMAVVQLITTNVITDTVNGFSGGTYTIKSAGKYAFFAQVATQLVTPSSVANSLIIEIHVNGVAKLSSNKAAKTTSNCFFESRVQGEIVCNVGDLITVRVYSELPTVTVATTAAYNYFSGFKIQAPNQVLASEKVVEKWSSNTGSYATGATILYEDKQTSTHGWYNPATGIFTAGRAGLLKVSAKVLIPSSSTSYTQLNLRNSGGSLLCVGPYATNVGAINNHVPNLYCVGMVNAGDTFKITLAHGIGGSVAVDNSDTIGQYNSVEFVME